MSEETLEELKAIIAAKPEGANYIASGYYLMNEDSRCRVFDTLGIWSVPLACNAGDIFIEGKPRLLSDIERIIELKEQVKAGYEAYARIEGVKQRYNAENKQLTEALEGVMRIFAAVPDGFYRNELSKARMALGLGVPPGSLADKDTSPKAKSSGDWFRSCGEDV